MSVNGQTDGVLRWPGRVVTADDVRRLNGHRELVLPPRAVVTPLALEELRTQGIQIRQEEENPARPATGLWGYGQDRAHSLVQSAARAVQRDGVALREWPAAPDTPAWARAVAECVARGDCLGGVLFCDNPALLCCVANKVAGLRAAAVATIAQAAQALLSFAPNLVAVPMPGRTFFEIRQILRTFCQAGLPRCPDGAACTLRELDGHAHR
jgi:hypothetical protein